MERRVKRLTRSLHDRIFGGVCAGLAEYLAVDVVLIRVVWIALTLLSIGYGVLVYVIAWIVIPLARDEEKETGKTLRPREGRFVLGVFLLLVGVVALTGFCMPWFYGWSHVRWVGPLLLVVSGLVLLGTRRERRAEDHAQIETAGTALPSGSSRRLTRAEHGRVIAGVCAGLGRYLDLDPTLVRLVFVVLLFFAGSGLVLYLLLWMVTPRDERVLLGNGDA